MRKRLTGIMLALAVLALFFASGCAMGDKYVPPSADLPEKTTQIFVYYATGRTIVEEKRVVADTPDVVKKALEIALKAQPQDNPDIAVVQPRAKVLSAKVDNSGLATVNFSKQILNFEASKQEKVLAFAAIVETVKQFKNVKKLKFQVEGKESGLLDGKKIENFWGDISLKGQPWDIDKVIGSSPSPSNTE